MKNIKKIISEDSTPVTRGSKLKPEELEKNQIKIRRGEYSEQVTRGSKKNQQTTQTGVELAKQRFEAWKKAKGNKWLTENPIEKYIPYTNGTFDVIFKSKFVERIYPNNRSQLQNEGGAKFYMGTYDGNWEYTMDDAKTTYDKYGDKAWLSDEEEKELGIKKNPDTGKYEKIDQTNTQNANSGGGSSTPRKRGTQLSSQDYEGIDFKYKYPGDKNYRYGVKGTDWYAKNINNQKIFNITKDGFTSSVDKLNVQFPNAFKEVVPPVSPETKTPETPTQDLTKVGTYVPPVKPVDSTNTGTYVPPVKPMDSTNTGTKTPPQVKFVDSTAYKLEKL